MATDRGDRFGLAWIGVLDGLGKQFGQHAYFGRRDGQHAGQRPKPDRAHEGQRPDQLVYPSETVEDPADGEMGQEVHHYIASAQKTQRQRDAGGQECAQERHGDAFGQSPQDVRPLRSGRRRHHLPQDHEQTGHAATQASGGNIEPPTQGEEPEDCRDSDADPGKAHAEACPESTGKSRPQPSGVRGRGHGFWPIARLRTRSEIRSIALTARMISTIRAPISW